MELEILKRIIMSFDFGLPKYLPHLRLTTGKKKEEAWTILLSVVFERSLVLAMMPKILGTRKITSFLGFVNVVMALDNIFFDIPL